MTMPTGTVLFFKPTANGGFGFIRCDEAPDLREANVWFGTRALRYEEPRTGDRVEYTLLKKPLSVGQGPAARIVELIDGDPDSIETLGGE